MSVIVRAKFPQGWRNNKYDKDEKMPANEKQGRRLTQAGVAYYDFEEDEETKELLEELQDTDDLTPLPADDLLKPHFFSIEDVNKASDEKILSIDGIGEKTLQEIREYFNG